VNDPAVRIAREPLEEGRVIRFAVQLDGVRRGALALRWHGQVRAWLDTCRHQSLPLSAPDGHVFDAGAGELVCDRHGARYRPDTGECTSGPCRGAFLTALALEERPDGTWCTGRGGPAGLAP
jgi:nitrite reductase/ring-hydroxylating ferredoxin subunit